MMFLLAASAAAGAAGASLMARFGSRLRLIDMPTGRSSHASPTPRSGGVGIVVAFVGAGIALRAPASFLLSGAALALVGLYDDLKTVSPKARLAFQAVAATIAVAGLKLTPAVSALGVFFIVGTANVFNFMDGIDGIAGLTGASAFGLLAAFARLSAPGDPAGTMAACLAAACVGFLPWNVPRAKVFMGDVGSLLLGFSFSYTALRLSRDPADFLCLGALLLIFYADASTTLWVRFKSGENLLQAHRRHCYQLLVNESGVAHFKVAAAYGFGQAAIGMFVLWARRRSSVLLAGFCAAAFVAFYLASLTLRRRLASLAVRPIEEEAARV